jgi:Tfp pilus assembly protein PilV
MLVLGVLLTAGVQFCQTRANESEARERDDAQAVLDRVTENLRMVRVEAPKEAFDLSNQAWSAFADGRYREAADLALLAQEKAREVIPQLAPVPEPG